MERGLCLLIEKPNSAKFEKLNSERLAVKMESIMQQDGRRIRLCLQTKNFLIAIFLNTEKIKKKPTLAKRDTRADLTINRTEFWYICLQNWLDAYEETKTNL
jgi:hypothetical protein